MDVSLHSVVSAKIHNIYVIKYKLANSDEYHAQMRLHRYTKKQFIYAIVINNVQSKTVINTHFTTCYRVKEAKTVQIK